MKTKINQIDGLDSKLNVAATAHTAGGTDTAITVTIPEETYRNGLKFTFIASATNAASAKTINMNGLGAKNFYKPGGTSAPSITSGKAYNVWYDGTSFFLQASAEGDAVVANVLAGKTFSNDDDTGLVGTMIDRAGDTTAVAVSRAGQRLMFRPSEGYRDGINDTVGHTDPNDIASNIRENITIRGLTGTLKASASGTGVTGGTGGISVTGLEFTPSVVVIETTGAIPYRVTFVAPASSALNNYMYSSSSTISLATKINVGASNFYCTLANAAETRGVGFKWWALA